MKKEDISAYLQSVEEIEEQEIEWLIPHWVPKGGITLLVGDGGVGKTNLWSFLLSRISAGLLTLLDLPDLEKDSPSPGPGVVAEVDPENDVLIELKNTSCLYFSKEDSTAKRLRKNFALYEANMREIHTVEIDRLVGFDYTSPELEKFYPEMYGT